MHFRISPSYSVCSVCVSPLRTQFAAYNAAACTCLSEHALLLQAAVEQLMQEWKVADFAVAESIFRSRQRQLRQKGGAQLRQKMQVCPCHQSCTLTSLSNY